MPVHWSWLAALSLASTQIQRAVVWRRPAALANVGSTCFPNHNKHA